ncbi:hypothetical protein SEVIR_8G051550v4 [Setaria viridis]
MASSCLTRSTSTTPNQSCDKNYIASTTRNNMSKYQEQK